MERHERLGRESSLRVVARVIPALAIVLSTLLLSAPSRAGKSFDFEFHDEEYLLPRQHGSGRAYVPAQVTADDPVPLVVFLHGVNRRNRLHMWLGSGPADLRARMDKWIARGDLPPAVLAAPSQTRDALWPAMLWTGIDLDEFVAAAERAVAGRARISHDQVIVAGHSGAGCNLTGGLLKIAADRGAIRPIGIVALDTCLDGEVGQALARASESTRIATYWQSVIWNRKVVDFAIGFGIVRQEYPPGNDWFEHVNPPGRWPHDALVAPSLLQAISVLLGPSATPDAVAAEAAASDDADLTQ
ncbi:MAG TPA: hypothetical protein VK540_27425 [Polyangiaceae bacterium]|nr:hypothetical protein [Polyangiaceae bacterium]